MRLEWAVFTRRYRYPFSFLRHLIYTYHASATYGSLRVAQFDSMLTVHIHESIFFELDEQPAQS